MRKLKDEIEDIQSPDFTKVVLVLAQAGHEYNQEMGGQFGDWVGKYSDVDTFILAIVQSIYWSRNIKQSEDWINLALDYFCSKNREAPKELGKYYWICSEDALLGLFKSWKYIIKSSEGFTPSNYSLGKLITFQERLVNHIFHLWEQKEIFQIGAWFCYMPCTAIAMWKKEYWEQEQLDNLILPLGIPVQKGLHWLVKNYPDTTSSFKGTTFNNLKDGIRATKKMMIIQREFAHLVKTRALHINTGLWLLGKEKDPRKD